MSLRKRNRPRTTVEPSAPESPAPRERPGETAPAPATAVEAPHPADPADPGGSGDDAPAGRRRSLGRLGPVLLARAAHPKQAVLTALGVAAAAALSGRPNRELGLVLATVLVGQVVVGWHNDLVDRERDRADERTGKPLADGTLDPGTVWFALACGVLLLVPLSLSNGVTAGGAYLLLVALSLLGNVLLRGGLLSWLPWAASFALYPAFLSYGGWGGAALGDPPEVAVTALAGALGVCVHFLRALPGLVADNRNGQRHLPLRVALRTGAAKLLWASIVVTLLVLVALAVVAGEVGLSQ